MVRLSKREDKTSLWVILAIGLVSNILGFFVGFFLWGWAIPIGIVGIFTAGIIGLFLGRGKETKKEEYFWCGLCDTKYQTEFLGAETAYEGKICRSCLGKRRRGETIHSSPQNQTYQPKEETSYYKPFQSERKFDTGKDPQRGILLRELNRKQRKKNGYLTQFIINLAVLQWLLPLLIILFFWITTKEQMKVEALKVPGLGVTTEIPFSQVFKDFFKILTSEFYTYGGHNISVSLVWKLGIIFAILLPLGFWIYNLVRFLGANGEIKQLETEVKEIDR